MQDYSTRFNNSKRKKEHRLKCSQSDENHLSKLNLATKHKHLIKNGPSESIKSSSGDFIYRKTFDTIKVDSTLSPFAINLPQSALHASLSVPEEDLPSPMCFHLISLSGINSCYANLKEVSSEESSVTVSEEIAQMLNLYPGPNNKIIVTLVDLPRGESLKLQVRGECLEDVVDLHAHIQAALSKYVVLHRDQQILLNINQSHSLGHARVIDFTPTDVPAIILTDCEIRLDLQIITNNSTNVKNGSSSSSYKSKFRELELGKMYTDNFETGPVTYYLSLDSQLMWATNSRLDQQIITKVSSTTQNCETPALFDVFISFPPLREASINTHHFASLAGFPDLDHIIEINKKRYMQSVLQLEEEIDMLEQCPNLMLIGLIPIANSPPHSQYQLSVHFHYPSMSLKSTISDSSNPTEEHTNCSNCGKSIPEQSMLLHSIHCTRFYTKCHQCQIVLKKEKISSHIHCEICNEGFSKEKKEQHKQLVHGQVACSCDQEIPRSKFVKHKRSHCPLRILRCRYCHLFVPFGITPTTVSEFDLHYNLSSHEMTCGAKTIVCEICSQNVPNKEYAIHLAFIHCFGDALNEKCPICNISGFSTTNDWKNHLNLHRRYIDDFEVKK